MPLPIFACVCVCVCIYIYICVFTREQNTPAGLDFFLIIKKR